MSNDGATVTITIQRSDESYQWLHPYYVYCDEQYFGPVKNNSEETFQIKPGKRYIQVQQPPVVSAVWPLKAEEGKTYRFIAKSSANVMLLSMLGPFQWLVTKFVDEWLVLESQD